MAIDKSSLIARAKGQMELIPSSQMPACFFVDQEESVTGEFTGERLFAQRPETYQLVVSLLAEKVGVIKIGRLLKVSPNTVRAVQLREGVSIDIEKERLAELCHQGAALAFEGVIEDLSDPVRRAKIPTRDKAVAGAVLVDKGQLLAGEATSRLDVRELAQPDHDDFNAYLEGLKRVGMGSGGGTAGGKGGVQGGPGTAGGVPGGVAVDVQSDGKREEGQ